MNEQNTTAEPETTLEQAAQTIPNVDMDAINKAAEARAERAAQTVVKDMLKQQGLDDESIAKMTAEWKAKQQTPEQIANEWKAKHDTAIAENATLKMQIKAIAKGVPADKADKYIALAKAYGDDFEKGFESALADFPIEKKEVPPPYAAGTGTASMIKTDNEKLRAALRLK